jgi:hypothetical protein
VDKREKRAQALLWEVQALRAAGDHVEAAKKSRVMARLHEELAEKYFGARDHRGWIHLQAAVTAWAKAGSDDDFACGFRLLARGFDLALVGPVGSRAIFEELRKLLDWMSLRQHPQSVEPAERPAVARDKRRAVA